MIKECLEIFSEILDKEGDRLILDNYLPKDGTYLLAERSCSDWNIVKKLEISYDKKQGEITGRTDTDYPFICQLDYYSKLIEMNKPVDSKKIIHSNNYLSLAVKKESLIDHKMTDEILDGYYMVLKNPRIKYTKSKNLLYAYEAVELDYGPVDESLLEEIHAWVKEHKDQLETAFDDRKGYLKVFFILPDRQETRKQFIKEGQRYLIPNIYNSSDYNVEVNGCIYGLPNDNMGMNSKKPYLENKTRKTKVPYLLNREDVLLQGKFYDYLMGLAARGCLNIFFDNIDNKIYAKKPDEAPEKDFSGYYLRLRKGKEVEIHSADTIVSYRRHLHPGFYFKQLLSVEKGNDYGYINKKMDLQRLIDEVFFGKSLMYNYFTKPGDLSIKDNCVKQNLLLARDRLFTWFYKDASEDVGPLLEQISARLVYNTIMNGYFNKAKDQLNLRWSFIDYFEQSSRMEVMMSKVENQLREHINSKDSWDFTDDDEYFYAVGQLINYFLSKSRAAKKPLSIVNPFLNAKQDDLIKSRLTVLFKKYNYDIFDYDLRVKSLYSHVKAYTLAADRINTDLLEAGLTANNLIYEKSKGDKQHE